MGERPFAAGWRRGTEEGFGAGLHLGLGRRDCQRAPVRREVSEARSRRQHRLVLRLEGVGGQEHEGERLIRVGRRWQVSPEREGGLWEMGRETCALVDVFSFFIVGEAWERGRTVVFFFIVRIALFPLRGADEVGWRLVARWLS